MTTNSDKVFWIKNKPYTRSHHKIYLCEPALEQEFHALTVPMDEFNAVATLEDPSQLVDAVRIAFLAHKTKKGSFSKVAGLLALYIKSTNTYQIAVEQTGTHTPLHILVNVYGRLGDDTAALRPAVIGVDAGLKSFEEVAAISRELLEYDKIENPHFFSTLIST